MHKVQSPSDRVEERAKRLFEERVDSFKQHFNSRSADVIVEYIRTADIKPEEKLGRLSGVTGFLGVLSMREQQLQLAYFDAIWKSRDVLKQHSERLGYIDALTDPRVTTREVAVCVSALNDAELFFEAVGNSMAVEALTSRRIMDLLPTLTETDQMYFLKTARNMSNEKINSLAERFESAKADHSLRKARRTA